MQDPWDQLAALAAQVHVYAPSRLHKLIATPDKTAYYFSIWKPGVLHLFGQLPERGASESELGDARRTAWLEQLAHEEMTRLRLPADDSARIQASCEQAWQEILQDSNLRPPIAFEADANARQVLTWLRFLKDRRCLPVVTE